MKKVLVLAAVVCVFATVGSASQLNIWLSANPTTTGYFPVQVWGQIVVDPNQQGEDIAGNGLSDFSITIYTPGTVGVAIPRPQGASVVTTWGAANINDWGLKVKPANGDFEGDGDADAVEASAGDTDGFNLDVAIGAPELLLTETWKMVSWASANLRVFAGPSSRHWTDAVNPDTGLPYRENFTAMNGATLHIGAPDGTAPTIDVVGPTGVQNTGAHGTKSNNFLLTVALTNVPNPAVTGGTLDFGDGASQALVLPLPDTQNHAYTLGGSETSHVYTYTATATNGIAPNGTDSGSFTLVESPAVAMTAEGIQYYDGNTVLMYPWDVMNISLAPSAGFIENWSIVNAVTGLNLSGVGTPGSQVIPVTQLLGTVTFTVSNNGAGLNSESMDVSFIPEPATLALLGFGAVAALIRRKK